VVCTRHGLRLIEQIREGELLLTRELRHFGGRICRVRDDVIRADRDNGKTARSVFSGKAHEAIQDVLDVRAVVAEKRHEQCLASGEILQCNALATRSIRESERWRSRAQREHRGLHGHGVAP
jgi:hypothetical protein